MSLSEARAMGAMDAICDEDAFMLHRPAWGFRIAPSTGLLLLVQPTPSKL